MAVTADVTVTINASDSVTGNTISATGDVISYQETQTTNYGASPLSTVAKQWSAPLTFVASTPQTFDLTALTGPRGVTVAFSSIRLIYIVNVSPTTAWTLTFGNPGTNAWYAPFDAATDTCAVPAGSRLLLENNDPSAPWAVDATHKVIKLDPGSHAVTARLIVIGS